MKAFWQIITVCSNTSNFNCILYTVYICYQVILFISQLLQPFHDRFMSLVHRDDFRSISHDATIQHTILGILDAMCGLVEARRPEQFQYLVPYLQVCLSLMEVYAGISEVITVILKLFSLVAEYSIIWRRASVVRG